jgi:hypothetical protein
VQESHGSSAGVWRACEGLPGLACKVLQGFERFYKMQPTGKLSRKQESLISALLLSPTLADAAQAVGIGEVTAWRWLKEPSVQDAYREARRAVVQHAIVQVQCATSEAVETLRAVMQDPGAPASARVSAAKAILETAVKAVALEDLDARIAALEAANQEKRID